MDIEQEDKIWIKDIGHGETLQEKILRRKKFIMEKYNIRDGKIKTASPIHHQEGPIHHQADPNPPQKEANSDKGCLVGPCICTDLRPKISPYMRSQIERWL